MASSEKFIEMSLEVFVVFVTLLDVVHTLIGSDSRVIQTDNYVNQLLHLKSLSSAFICMVILTPSKFSVLGFERCMCQRCCVIIAAFKTI